MSEPTRLYRWFDADGTLLYVGISSRPFRTRRPHLHARRHRGDPAMTAIRILAVVLGVVAIACGALVALAGHATLLTVAYVTAGAFGLGALFGSRDTGEARS